MFRTTWTFKMHPHNTKKKETRGCAHAWSEVSLECSLGRPRLLFSSPGYLPLLFSYNISIHPGEPYTANVTWAVHAHILLMARNHLNLLKLHFGIAFRIISGGRTASPSSEAWFNSGMTRNVIVPHAFISAFSLLLYMIYLI
jgi:hypothetical protein